MSKPILHIKDISVSYDNTNVLKNISIELRRGTFYCLIGENGSGKSTFLKSIIGIVPIKNGTIELNNTDISNLSVHERTNLGIGYLGQTNNIFPKLTVHDHIEMAKGNNSINNTQVLLKEFPELEKLKNTHAGLLSGGQQRLLGMIIALIQHRELLILDEPFAGVSVEIQKKMKNILLDYIEHNKVCILMVEQNEEIVSQFKNEIINIKNLKFNNYEK